MISNGMVRMDEEDARVGLEILRRAVKKA